jgi:hypothetical protein
MDAVTNMQGNKPTYQICGLLDKWHTPSVEVPKYTGLTMDEALKAMNLLRKANPTQNQIGIEIET